MGTSLLWARACSGGPAANRARSRAGARRAPGTHGAGNRRRAGPPPGLRGVAGGGCGVAAIAGVPAGYDVDTVQVQHLTIRVSQERSRIPMDDGIETVNKLDAGPDHAGRT